MAKAKRLKVIFNGVSDVETQTGSESFYSGFMGIYDPGEVKTFSATLTGSNWNVFGLNAVDWGNKSLKANITDGDAGTGRQINVLDVGYNSKVTLISTSVIHLEGHDGALHDVTLGSGYTRSVTLSADRNILKTGEGLVQSIYTDGSSNIDIGSGGAHSVWTGAGADVIKAGTGWVGSIRTGDGDDKIFATTSVGDIYTGAGDDVVVTSGQWLEKIHLGAGDDTVVVKKLDAWFTLRVEASSNTKNGVDTLDFSKLTMGVRFELGNKGAWQEVYKSKKVDAWVSETGIENVIGTRKKDILTAGSLDNELTGGKAKDVFVFGKNTGDDTVTDFEVGLDIIQIKGHKGGFAALEFLGGDIVLNGGTVDLIGVDASALTQDSFQFA